MAASSTCLTASTRRPSRSNVSSHQTASASNCCAHLRHASSSRRAGTSRRGSRGGARSSRSCWCRRRSPVRNQLGVRGEVLVLLVHVVDHEVHEHADAVGVRLGDHRLQRGLAAEARIDLARLDRPVAVVAGDLVDAVGGRGTRRCGLVWKGVSQSARTPSWSSAPRGDDLAGRPRDRRSGSRRAGRRSASGATSLLGVAVLEAIGHRHVDERVVPVEALALDPEDEAERRRDAAEAVLARRRRGVYLPSARPESVDGDGVLRGDRQRRGRVRRSPCGAWPWRWPRRAAVFAQPGDEGDAGRGSAPFAGWVNDCVRRR